MKAALGPMKAGRRLRLAVRVILDGFYTAALLLGDSPKASYVLSELATMHNARRGLVAHVRRGPCEICGIDHLAEAERIRETRGNTAFGFYGGSPASGLSYKHWFNSRFVLYLGIF